MWNTSTAMVIIATKKIWNKATQRCQPTGRKARKSTLQKVTKRMKNMKSGRMVSKNGSIVSPTLSNAGMKANNR